MNRRTVIKQLALAGGAVLLIPSCMQHDKAKASVHLKNIEINGDGEKLLASLSETMIPKSNTPGANDIGAHLFALKMVDDCFKKDEQQKFMQGLKAFDAATKKQFSNSFPELSDVDKGKLLHDLEGKKTGEDNLNYFYSALKKLTIKAYTTSEFYLTHIQIYTLVPGHYYGCVPVTKA